MKRLLLLTITLLSLQLQAQTLETNLIELNYAGSSKPRYLTTVNNKVFFAVEPTGFDNDRALMVYDNVTGATYKVKPEGGPYIDNNALFTVDNSILYFINQMDYSLWRSDGTESGTYKLYAFQTGNSQMSNFAVLNNNIYFTARDNVNGIELWRTDGTAAGTHIVTDIYPGELGSHISNIAVCNNMLYFFADHPATGKELWKSDGTAAGTSLIKDILPGPFSGAGERIYSLGTSIYFMANNGISGYELWKSDGTADGTQLFKEFVPGSSGVWGLPPEGLNGIVMGNQFLFAVPINGTHWQLWTTDGTTASTILLHQTSSMNIDLMNQFVQHNNEIYFVNSGYDDCYLWKTNATVAGTQLVQTIPQSHVANLTSAGQYLIMTAHGFTGPPRPWVSNGTPSGTFQLVLPESTLSVGGDMKFATIGNTSYFAGTTGELNGVELWETQGTVATTKMVTDITHDYAGTTGQGKKAAAVINNKLVFAGNNGVNYIEPFVSNGTAAGTFMLKDILLEPFYGSLPIAQNGDTERIFVNAGNRIFFPAYSDATGLEIHATDGTSAGTTLVKDINPGTAGAINTEMYFLEYNGIFYFKANNPSSGQELWRTDGTNAGTYLVKDINPGAASGLTASNAMLANNKEYAVMNGYLYFPGMDATGHGIWKTDGTEAGTTMVISLSYQPSILGATPDKLFFANGSTLLSTDGTQAGIITLNSYNSSTNGFRNAAIHNNEIYFGASVSSIGYSIMKSNGTVAGTVLVKGPISGGNVQYIESYGNYAYFSIGNSYSSEYGDLWRTDGTEAGTVPIANDSNSSAMGFTPYGDKLLFLKSDDRSKLWVTDGNPANTTSINVMVSDGLNESGAYITNIMGVINDTIYLEANGELCVSNISGVLSSGQDTLVLNRAAEKVIMYPNPTNGLFTLKSQFGETIQSYEIYDLTGKQVMAKSVDAELATCDVSKLSKGIYLVKVKTARGAETKKLVRE